MNLRSKKTDKGDQKTYLKFFFIRFNKGCSSLNNSIFEHPEMNNNFLNFLNNRHPNVKFTIEKQINHSNTFLMY